MLKDHETLGFYKKLAELIHVVNVLDLSQIA